MMLAPNGYVLGHKNDTYEQLIKERNSLVREIKRLEKIVFEEEKTDVAWNYCPSPEVSYQVLLSYLSELSIFMQEKFNREYVHAGEE